MSQQVLLIEDDDALRMSLAQTLELAGLNPMPMTSFVQARRHIRANFAGVILSDIRMPHQDGFLVLETAQRADHDLPVILMTGHSDVPTAMKAMREGAYDYLEKPCNPDRLLEVLKRALEHRTLVLRARKIERALERSDAVAIHFPGHSKASEQLRTLLRQIAASRQHVHLWGDVGVGKKLAGYAIYQLAVDPTTLVQVNMKRADGNVFRNLTISSGPVDLICKYTERASADQIADLLALIQRHDNLRVISTSEKRFDEIGEAQLIDDLRETGHYVELRVPNLSERREDLPMLFEVQLRQLARTLDIDLPDIPQSVLSELMTRSWNGNVPELREFANGFVMGRQENTSIDYQTLAEQLDAYERLILSETMTRHGGRVSKAAQALGVPRNTLYDRLARYDLSAKDFRPKGS